MYQDQIMQTTCKNCGLGKNQVSTGQTTCVVCGKGKISDHRIRPCVSCKAGQFQHKLDAAKFSSVGGTRVFSLAKPNSGFCSDISGQKVITTALKCAQARDLLKLGGGYANTNSVYQGSWNHLPQGCSMWGNNVHFNTYGQYRRCNYNSKYCICDTSANCDICTQGKEFMSVSTVCDNCAEGKYQGENSASGVKCKDCVVGQYADETGRIKCKQCGQGAKSPLPGAKDCKLCTVGQYSDEVNVDECKDCQSGKYVDEEGLQLCKICTGGQYQATTRGFGCDKCVIGRYGNELG